MVNSSKGIKGTLLSTLLIIVIVAAAYLIARGHTIEIPDVANGGFFRILKPLSRKPAFW